MADRKLRGGITAAEAERLRRDNERLDCEKAAPIPAHRWPAWLPLPDVAADAYHLTTAEGAE